MAKVLTARSVEQTKPDCARRREIPDGLLPGLYLIVQPSGAKSWAVRYRQGGRPCKLTLGPVAALDLAEAREAARDALRKVARGDDPAAERKAAKAAAEQVDRDLFRNIVRDFGERHGRHNRSWPEVERMLGRDVLPRWGDRRIQDISRRDVIELLDAMVDRGVRQQANRVFAAVRKIMNWAVSRDIIAVSPCAGLKPPVPEISRDRILSDDEVRWFWKACGAAGYPFGALFHLLLLTGQRRDEVGGMTAAEVDRKERLWTLPRARTKNDTPHQVPLSGASMAVLERLPKIRGKAGYVFTTIGETPVSGWSRAKANLDKAMLAIARREAEERGEEAGDVTIPAWRLHDLRRTAASGMARLGVAVHVVEAVLNHRTGTISGIALIYNRYQYSKEQQAALEAWGRYVTQLVEPGAADKVVRLRESAR